jgi:two-component system sensor histidine kinase ChvG
MVIMLVPLLLFFIGLFSIDQYRTTLISSEFTALERQGFTLARSLALAEAERDIGVAKRRLSPQTMNHLLPLVGYGTQLRARVFQPNGMLLADTARRGSQGGDVSMQRNRGEGWRARAQDSLNALMLRAAAMLGDNYDLPYYRERARQNADNYQEVLMALDGEASRQLRRDRQGNMVLSVAVPIKDLRVVRGALLVSISGGKIEKEVAEVNIAFIQLFGAVLLVTIALSVYLARSITVPITHLAKEADMLRKSRDLSARIQRLPKRRDEIGRLSESFIDLTDELQQRMVATAGFAADVAHELKNPLSSLRSAAETISHISDPAQQQKLMDVILKDVARLDRLISDISQASRVDNEIASHDGAPVDLCKLVDSFVQTRQATIETHKLVQHLGEAPVEVMIHDSRIVQVLDNLLANAVSFAPPNSTITITLGTDAQASNAILTFADEGPGIPPGRLESVFNRFYTERPSAEAFGQHSGLGLSIARQIVRGHGGELTASNISDNKTGACFTMTLPLMVTQDS